MVFSQGRFGGRCERKSFAINRMPSDEPDIRPAQQAGGRAYALDALRGFAILMMVLCSVIPFGVLPPWMYHAQTPPPSHEFIPLPGLTWVDLVFPFFLFAMGAAFPLSVGRKLEKPGEGSSVAGQTAFRALLLAGFGIYLEHVRPFVLAGGAEKTAGQWLMAMLGFGLLFTVLTRFPKDWKPATACTIRICGLAAMLLLLFFIKYPDGSGFSIHRSDIIIMFLSAMAWAGTAVYAFTRASIPARLGVMAVLLAIKLFDTYVGFPKWTAFPLPWLFDWPHLRYLFVVIPGTIAGDIIAASLKQPRMDTVKEPWRYLSFAALMLCVIAATLCGLQARNTGLTALADGVLLAAAFAALPAPESGTEKALRGFFLWGTAWFALGLLLEPYEGGIKKDPPTLSYYFTTAGLALFALSALTVACDIFGKRRQLAIFIENGQNPMIAYAASANFIAPVLALTGLGGLMSRMAPTPWLGFWRGVFETALTALFVAFFTRRKIFWRT